jgi:hypothetical protein
MVGTGGVLAVRANAQVGNLEPEVVRPTGIAARLGHFFLRNCHAWITPLSVLRPCGDGPKTVSRGEIL